jgi:hypothetical protein
MTIHDEDMDGGHDEDKNNNDLSKIDSGSPCSSDASSFHSQKAEVRKTNNVSELVAKSKKAASSLWTLLHAKVRNFCLFASSMPAESMSNHGLALLP